MYKLFFVLFVSYSFFLCGEEPPIRDYFAEIRPQEFADISFIVTTCSDKSTIKLYTYQTALEDAGERVLHVHPFNFLRAIFADDVLKVKIRNVRKRGLVWPSFIGRLEQTFNEEMARENLPLAFVDEFAAIVAVDPTLLYPALLTGQWEQFVDLLIKHVPRNDDGDRYDM